MPNQTLAVFGATGRTGQVLVRQALERGYEVRALVRDPAKLAAQQGNPEGLEAVQGDATDPLAVERTVEGADPVVSMLGQVKGGSKTLLGTAAGHILGAMRRHGVKRLILLSGAGVSADGDQPKLMDRAIVGLLKLISREVYEDSLAAVQQVRSSALDWTVVRAPMLSDGPKTGVYRVGSVGKDSGTRISRADLADFILRELEDGGYRQKLPVVSY